MSTALGFTPMDQTPFVASNVDLADVGSPMQQDEESPVLGNDREKAIAEMKTPTAEELDKAGLTITERMTAFNQDNYPENYARCKQLYHFGREHITQLLGAIPFSAYEDEELWARRAKEFMYGCEEVHKWLDAQDALDDDDWEDEEEELEREREAMFAAINARKEAKDVKVDAITAEVKPSTENVATKD